MGEISILLLSWLYFISGTIYLVTEIYGILKYKRIRTIAYFRILYAVIYGFLPGIYYIHFYLTGESAYSISYSVSGVSKLYLLYVLSIIVYLFLNLGYKTSLNSIPGVVIKNRKKFNITWDRLFLASNIIFVLGFLSFFLWTKAYGSLFGVIDYASALRSGVVLLDNSFSFMKRTSTLMIFSSYMYFALFLNMKRGISAKKIIVFVLMLISSFWSVIYLLSNDGRMSFIYFFLIFILYFIFRNHNSNFSKKFIKVSVFLLIAFIGMAFSDWIMFFLRHGELSTSGISFNLFSIIREELGYTILSGQTSLFALENGQAGFRILTDLLSGILAFFPSRFRPDSVDTLFSYNTELLGVTNGTVPTDLIAMCIYDLGIIGVIIIPFVLGWIIKKIEKVLTLNRGNAYYDMLYVIISLYLARFIAYADPANYVHAIIFIIVGHIIVRFVGFTRVR